MRTDCLSNIDFQGKVVILNTLSHKPNSSLKKVENNLQKQVQSKNYDLYIEQDYSLNKINIGVSPLKPRTMSGNIEHEELPITAKSKRYIYAAKSAIDKHEKRQKEKEVQVWEQEQKKQKKQNIYDAVEFILYCPFYIVEHVLHDINPKFSQKYDKLLQKIGLYL